jgi:hypothetical protein
MAELHSHGLHECRIGRVITATVPVATIIGGPEAIDGRVARSLEVCHSVGQQHHYLLRGNAPRTTLGVGFDVVPGKDQTGFGCSARLIVCHGLQCRTGLHGRLIIRRKRLP